MMVIGCLDHSEGSQCERKRLTIRIFSILVSLCLILAGAKTFAFGLFPPMGGGSGSASDLSGTPLNPTRSTFNFAVGLFYGTGSMGNQSGSVASRSVSTSGAYALLGFTSGFLAPFAYTEYNTSQQTTPAAIVSGTNLAGSGTLTGAGLTFLMGKFHLTGTYLWMGTYTLSQSTPLGQSASYSNPNGYVVSLEYNFHGGWSVAAVYRSVTYSTYTQGGVDSSIRNDTVTQSATGGVFQWGF